MPEIAVVGTGYVGLTTGTCLAHVGHSVVCVDIDDQKIGQLEGGEIPFLEEGLPELVRENREDQRLRFSIDLVEAVSGAEFIFLCLPTPQAPNGDADLQFVISVAREIGPVLRTGAVVVNKSTVPVGTSKAVQDSLERNDVFVVSNPEFLREGSAVRNFLHPDRIVVGADNSSAALRVASLYQAIPAPVVVTDAASAEMIKYAANAFLATKLSFANAVAAICEGVGADVESVLNGVGYDKRIGHEFMKPSPGWGGSCLPKDTSALIHVASKTGFAFELLEAVVQSNQNQLDRIAQKVVGTLVPGETVAVWGLTFKAMTDDLRESPALQVVKRLLSRGLKVVGYDPTVSEPLADWPGLEIAQSELAACTNASVIAILTEWDNFRVVDPKVVATVMKSRRVVDGRNIIDTTAWGEAGFDVECVGKPAVPQSVTMQ
jgi:UDPglucose 6-dehydrogenase